MPVEHVATERRPEPRRTHRPLIIAIVALFILAVIGLVLAHQFSGQNVIEAKPPAPLKGQPVITTPLQPAPAAAPIAQTPKPGQPQPAAQPPADVVRYLEHLKRVDNYRIQMQKGQQDQISGLSSRAMGGIFDQLVDGDLDGVMDTLQKLQASPSAFIPMWQKLIRWFDSVPPPAECKPLHDSYYDALSAVVISFSNLQTLTLQGSSTGLKERGQNTSAQIDAKFAEADRDLADICAKYGLQKPVDIRPDPPAGSLLDLSH